MTNSTQQGDADKTAEFLHELNAPQRDLVATLRKMEASFKQQREFIQQHRSDKQVGEFPALEGIETKNMVDLEILKVSCWVALRNVEQCADEVEKEVDEAE